MAYLMGSGDEEYMKLYIRSVKVIQKTADGNLNTQNQTYLSLITPSLNDAYHCNFCNLDLDRAAPMLDTDSL